ncbi:MAG: hypothetical protein ACHQVS_04730 [Candidatus Babeliales bacterium]
MKHKIFVQTVIAINCITMQLHAGERIQLSRDCFAHGSPDYYFSIEHGSKELGIYKGTKEKTFILDFYMQYIWASFGEAIIVGDGKIEIYTYKASNPTKKDLKLIKIIPIKKGLVRRAYKDLSSSDIILQYLDGEEIVYNPNKDSESGSKKKESEGSKYSQMTYSILGLPQGASDAQILGLSEAQLNDKKTVRKAYLALVLIWHPDHMTDNDTAKARYAKEDVSKLSEDEKTKLANDVFKLIDDAYNRHK